MTTNFKKLVYVPILHMREDSDQAASVRRLPRTLLRGENEKSGAKDVRFNADHSAVGEMWADITAKITECALPWNKTRIYQDGLPVCGEELKIVTRLDECRGFATVSSMFSVCYHDLACVPGA